ncbi:MAG TPA: multiheme c-type cytochrome [Alphaproteobacteria bacterium]|nr:multiheme c-type cytochrome [Alphaproteobacteria bacterium]
MEARGRDGFGINLLLVLLGLLFLAGREAPAATAQSPTYVGSLRCRECHDKIYATWRQTIHAQAIQDVSQNPRAIQGDWTQPFDLRTFTKQDVRLTHGIQWKQRYIDKDWHILPAQWNFEDNTWAPTPDAKTWQATNWITSCAQCHVTGFDPEKRTWKELSIGCEACHGPGSAHVEAKPADRFGTIVNPASLPFDYAASVCGQCHTRGASPDGKWPHPIGFQVGDMLTTAHFRIVPKDNQSAWWPDGSVKQHRQQYPEWKASKHAKAGVTCITCHAVHEAPSKFATRLTPNNLCIACHSNVSTDSVIGHAPIANAPQHSNCIGCHMAPVGKSATVGDERVHTFRVVKPAMTIDLGGGDVAKQPNSCNGCHWHRGDPPQKLQQALDAGLALRFQQETTQGAPSQGLR